MGKTFAEILQDMRQMVVDEINDHDWAGSAELYAKLSSNLLDSLRQHGYTMKTFEPGDGYFIFGFGTNTTLSYRLNECPGWLFGVWWDTVEGDDIEKLKNGNLAILHGTWFAQYEKTIDKFKPTASVFTGDITVYNDGNLGLWDVMHRTDFIRKQPSLAFCRDYFMWDLNEEYHSSLEAWFRVQKVKYDLKMHEIHKAQLWKKWFRLCKKVIGKDGDNVYIHDRGPNWSPRYILLAVDKEANPEGEPNYIDLNVDEPYVTPYSNGVKKLEKIAKKWNLFFHEDSTITFVDKLDDKWKVKKL